MRTIKTTLCCGLLAVLVMSASASCGGSGGSSQVSPSPSPAPAPAPAPAPTPAPAPPAAPATLSTLTLAASVVGGNSVQGTVTLTAAAPTGGAVVGLSSSGVSAVVPANTTVAAGETSATFTITTPAVDDPRDVTITATFSGVSRTQTLRINPIALVARFSVVSASRGNNACAIQDGGSGIDCSLDGRASLGNVKAWKWTYYVGSNSGSHTSSEGLSRPQTGCGFFGGQKPTESGGVQFIQMEVELVVADARGVESETTTNRNIRLFPNRNCGYGF